jgi:hypothetical protein
MPVNPPDDGSGTRAVGAGGTRIDTGSVGSPTTTTGGGADLNEAGQDNGATDAPADGSASAASCPSSISFTGTTETPLRGGNSGSPYSDSCPAGEVVVGFILSQNSSPPATVGEMTVICGAISIKQANCEINIGPGATLPTRGATANTPPVTQQCPPNQMVVAIQGASGSYLVRLGAGCAPLTLSRVGSTYQATVGSITWFSPEGGSGGTSFVDPCPTGQIANGAFTRSGLFMDAADLICSTPVLSP